MDLYAHLQQLATASSFERGEHYFEKGAVSKLVKKGNEYEAVVAGSRRYKQYIKIADGFQGTCSCPYDHGGICKHLVAVGLAIAEEAFTEIQQAHQEVEEEEVSMEAFFSEVYEEANPGQKLTFLRQLLEKNAQLRGQFASFVAPHDRQTAKVSIDQIRKEMEERLEKADFSYETLIMEADQQNQAYYSEEWDLLERGTKILIEALFKPVQELLRSCLEKGHPEDAMRVLLGTFEGFNLHDEAPGDRSGYLDDFYESLWEEYQGGLTIFMEYLEESIVTPALLKRLQDLWFERWDHYEKTYDYNHPETSIRYDLERFTELLLALAPEEVSLHYLDIRLQTYNLQYERSAAHLQLGIVSKQEDWDRWIEISETFAAEDVEIGQDLLKHYEQKGNRSAFVRLARPLYEVYGESLGPYLVATLSPDEDRDLYIRILTDQLSRTNHLNLYKIWRKMVPTEEKEAFIEQVSQQRFSASFHLQLLEVEDRFDEIYALAQQEFGGETPYYNSYSLVNYLIPILEHYPEFCFNILSDAIAKSVVKDRGREAYRTICEWLKLLQQIPGYESQTKIIIQECYKQRLPALKDEMRKAGFVNVGM